MARLLFFLFFENMREGKVSTDVEEDLYYNLTGIMNDVSSWSQLSTSPAMGRFCYKGLPTREEGLDCFQALTVDWHMPLKS